MEDSDKKTSNKDNKEKSIVRRVSHKGRYLMDYEKKYGDPYDVRDKARQHMLKVSETKR